MQAIGNYIIIEVIHEEIKSSGLLLTGEDKQNQRYRKGLILSVGTLIDSLKENDIIYYDFFAGHQMVLEGQAVQIISLRDIVVKI